MNTKDLVESIINDLKTILVPAEYLDQMGPPLSRSLSRLKILDQAIIAAEEEQRNAKEAENANADTENENSEEAE